MGHKFVTGYLRAIIFILFICCPIVFAESEGFNVEYMPDRGQLTIPFGRKYDYRNILVKRAIDGDTLLLEDGMRLRLIGIDTPEMHNSDKLYRDSRNMNKDIHTIKTLGRRAWAFTRQLTEGQYVRLEFDVEKYDKYGRILAYAFLMDGTFINAKIIEEGYAFLLTIPPNVKYVDLFIDLYQNARANRRGLWKED